MNICPKAQYDYHISQISPAESFSVDLISPTETFGTIWLSNFLDVSSLLAKSSQIRKDYRSSRRITEKLTELSQSYGISLNTLYRYESRPGICQVSKLYLDPVYMQNHVPKDMCLLAIDLAYYLWLSKDAGYKQNDILRECKKLKGIFSCNECILLKLLKNVQN